MKKNLLLAWLVIVLALSGFTRQADASWLTNSKTDAPAASAKYDSVYDILKNQKDLSRFVDLISEAGLKGLFTSTDQTLTVFAPNNSAVGDISSANMKHIKANKDNLQNFVKAHVVVGSRITANAMNGRKFSAAAASGDNISFDGTGKNEAPKVNEGKLIAGDLQYGSSIVHIVNIALIPQTFVDVPAAAKEDKKEAAPTVPIGTQIAPIAPTVTTKTVPVGPTVPAGTSVPVGTAHTAPASVAAPLPVAPANTDAPQSKGFYFFGHHFGGD